MNHYNKTLLMEMLREARKQEDKIRGSRLHSTSNYWSAVGETKGLARAVSVLFGGSLEEWLKWAEENRELDIYMKEKQRVVTVCGNCLQASCWQGIFMCDEAEYAGITQKTVEELQELSLENPCYWENNE